MDGWMDGWTHGWMDGWMDAWMDAWMHGWIGRQIYPMMGASYGAQSIRQSTYKPTLIHHNYTFTSLQVCIHIWGVPYMGIPQN